MGFRSLAIVLNTASDTLESFLEVDIPFRRLPHILPSAKASSCFYDFSLSPFNTKSCQPRHQDQHFIKTNISGPSSSALTTWNIPEPRADAQVPGPRRTTLLLFWTCKRNELHEGVSYNHVKVLLKAFLSTSDMLRVPIRAHTLTKFQIGSKKKFAVVCQTSELIYKFQATPQVLREGTGEGDGVRNPYGRWTPPYFYRNTQCV